MALSPTAIVAKGNTLTISSEGESRAMNGAEKAAVTAVIRRAGRGTGLGAGRRGGPHAGP